MKHFLHKLTFLLTWLFDTNESDLILFLLTLPEQVCWSHIQGDTNAVQTSSKSCDPAWYVCFPSLRFLVLKSTISFEFQNLSGKYTSLKNPMRLFHSNCLPEQKLLVLFDVPCYPSLFCQKKWSIWNASLFCCMIWLTLIVLKARTLNQSWFVFDFCPKVYYPLSNSGVKSKPNCYLFSKTLLTQGILFGCGKHDPKLAA